MDPEDHEKDSGRTLALDIRVSRKSVAKLLKQMNFSLRTNKKKISNGSPPDRDAQFANIAELWERFDRRGNPILSVDAKNRELVGRFKNPGRVWARESNAVNDHDFRSMAKGIAIPYGIYDLQGNRGTVISYQISTTEQTLNVLFDGIEDPTEPAPTQAPQREVDSGRPEKVGGGQSIDGPGAGGSLKSRGGRSWTACCHPAPCLQASSPPGTAAQTFFACFLYSNRYPPRLRGSPHRNREGGREVELLSFRLENPKRLVFDFKGVINRVSRAATLIEALGVYGVTHRAVPDR